MQIGTEFNGGKFWVGRHSADGDTLVFDPALAIPQSPNVCFFSLTQFRPRTFPPSVVQGQIQEVVDDKQRKEALERYREWPKLKEAHDHTLERGREQASVQRREVILANHQHYLEARGIPYKGVRDSSEITAKPARKGRRMLCSRCRSPLDDYIGARCNGCDGVLCSCGACACGPITSEV